jgi:predicted restriction endonuclease
MAAAASQWSRQELLIALSLYCQMPFGKMYARNPDIVAVAERIGRTPSALAMKLTNFASLDPEIRSTGRRGLANASAADKAIWDNMQLDWERFAVEVDRAITAAGLEDRLESSTGPTSEDERDDYVGLERRVEAVGRVGQQFFRRAVLSAYDYRCCITGLAVPSLLLASHIVPWKVDPSNRLNPRNGLCLSALHDRAFDAGIITISEDLRVQTSSRVSDDAFYRLAVSAFDGRPITIPGKFRPSSDFLRYHRESIFLG